MEQSALRKYISGWYYVKCRTFETHMTIFPYGLRMFVRNQDGHLICHMGVM